MRAAVRAGSDLSLKAFRLSLRQRMALAFAAFGGLVSVLLALALGLWMSVLNLEHRLLDEALSAELADYAARRTRNPRSLPPRAAGVRGFVSPGADAGLPPALRDLPPGRFDITLADTPYRAAVSQRAGARFVLLYDQTQLFDRQRHFALRLAAGVLLVVLLFAAGAFWLAGRVIAPVTRLAALVRHLNPRAPAGGFARDFPGDEVGALAHAFDNYLARLQAFVVRESAFTADVSHELRTPLAIIQGAVEVLREQAGPELERPLARLERAAQEMSELIAAFLVLAREERGGAPAASCDLAEVLPEVVERHRYLAARKPVTLVLEPCAGLRLPVERVVAAVVAGNLLRNAIAHTAAGQVRLRLEGGELSVADTGSGIAPEDLPHVFRRLYRGAESHGAGLGLAIVKRICDQYHWQVAVESEPERGTTVRVRFGPGAG